MEMVHSSTSSSTKDFWTTISKMRYFILANPLLFWTCEPLHSSSMLAIGNVSLNSPVRPPLPIHLQSYPCPLSSSLAPHPPLTLMTPPSTLTPQTHTPYLPLTLTLTPLMIPSPRILIHLPLAQMVSPLMPSLSPLYCTLDGCCHPLCTAWVPAQRYYCELHSFPLWLSCVLMTHPLLPPYSHPLSHI